MKQTELFAKVTDVARFLRGWRCDQRGDTPRLVGPQGAHITIRQEKGEMIAFSAYPPSNHNGRYRSWQSWGIDRQQWYNQTIKCSARRPANQVANDLRRRLLNDVEHFWPIAIARRRSEQTEIETLQHVTDLFLRMLPGAQVSTWNSCDTSKQIGFDGGQCEVTTYRASASLKLYDLSFDEVLKLAAFYQQMLNNKAREDGQDPETNR